MKCSEEKSPMHSKRRYSFIFAFFLLVGCIALYDWAANKFSLPFQHSNRIVTTLGAYSISTPTPQPSLDMNSGAHLLIPAIGVDAPIEPVGVLPNGSLNVPQKNRWTGVGWYKNGPVPGQIGSAIIDGHLDRPGGVPAVFWQLNQLHIGAIVTVMGAQGQALHFHVVQVQVYQPDKAPLAKIYGDTSGTYLNLITCEGPWIPSQHQTAERLVVYTKMI
jgi:sortase (surface protein transpeptidase)